MPYTIEGTVIDGIAEPILGDGTTFVPLANVAQSLGGYANYDHASKTASIELGGTVFSVQDGNPLVSINSELLTLQAPPFIEGDMLWVPVRLFAALGFNMAVDGDHVQLSS